jgi:hypothetical protein
MEVSTTFAKRADFVALSDNVKRRMDAARGAKAKKAGAAGKQARKSNVVYLGHIPHGFYEDQMRGFFNQFGDVLRLRLSRSKKTGEFCLACLC